MYIGMDGKPGVSYLLKKTLRILFTQRTVDASIDDTCGHTTVVAHLCFDNCSKVCKCGSADYLLKYPSKKDDKERDWVICELWSCELPKLEMKLSSQDTVIQKLGSQKRKNRRSKVAFTRQTKVGKLVLVNSSWCV